MDDYKGKGIKMLKKKLQIIDDDDPLAPFLVEIIKYGLECKRCGYKWIPKNKKKIPHNCANPDCNSPYWNVPRRK